MSLIVFVVITVWAKDVEIKFQESTAAINQRQLQLRGRDAERKRGFEEGERETQVCITNALCCLWWFDDDRCLNVINCILTILNLKSLPYIYNI